MSLTSHENLQKMILQHILADLYFGGFWPKIEDFIMQAMDLQNGPKN